MRETTNAVRVRVWNRVGPSVSSSAWILLGRHVEARVRYSIWVLVLESM